LRSKALDVPLSKLLGGYRERVPAYASHLLFCNWSIDDLKRDASALKNQGFRMMKMNMGDRPFKAELKRLKAVREVVGDEVDILVDINWAWDLSEAIKRGKQLAEHNVFWMEDPLASEDPQQLAILVDRLDIPIAVGETFSTQKGFRNLIENRAADVLIIDIQRVGGITEWIRVANMAQAWNIPVANHLFHDFSIHLVAAVPNSLGVEYMPWWDKIYINPPRVNDGHLDVPKSPGLGLELNPDALEEFKFE
jgi:L-talarate/galactarate dehydratase